RSAPRAAGTLLSVCASVGFIQLKDAIVGLHTYPTVLVAHELKLFLLRVETVSVHEQLVQLGKCADQRSHPKPVYHLFVVCGAC
ncbi:hypothetical protein LC574_29640, partial [Nostoc sp. CHAB 5715]|nr:hypothetical protein [Nostoc sp. CHAB 5715]